MSLAGTLSRWADWLGFGSGALATDVPGAQMLAAPRVVGDAPAHGALDRSLALSAVWGCVDLLTKTISTLPLFVYEGAGDRRRLARGDALYVLLHDAPNRFMTPRDFWTGLLINRFLRGNGYARIERNGAGTAIALWPMAADQVVPVVTRNGDLVYEYSTSEGVVTYADRDVLHIKGMGNGLLGLSPLDYMRSTTAEASYAQDHAARLFANGDKPAGLLMVDRVLNAEQREAIRRNFTHMAAGADSRLHVLEAGFKYEPISLRPQDVQLLETRRFAVEEIARWFGVPAVLLNHANVTTWGSGVEQLLAGFYKLTIRPELEGIEQAIAQRVFTPAQRARYTAEFNFEGLLRGSAAERFDLYAKAVQNGIMTRAEARQLENLPPMEGADELTAQSNLVPLDRLGQMPGGSQPAASDAAALPATAQ